MVVVSEAAVFAKSAAWSMADAAGFAVVYLTAWFAIHELVHPRPGQRVLVHSAAGGVGSALTQLAVGAGCEVFGVVRGAHKVAVAEGNGAVVIDAAAGDLWSEAERLSPRGYDAIFDANGVATLRASYAHLAAPGKLVVYGFHSMLTRGRDRPDWLRLPLRWLRSPTFDPLDMTGSNKSVLAFNLSWLGERQDLLVEGMQFVLDLAERHVIAPLPHTTFPFDRVADAHAALESGATTGKLVLIRGD
jgi:NADPH:quinone reductase-like Zn-dependent oxidoreductase